MITYQKRDSAVHSLDPRVKLAYLLFLSLALILKPGSAPLILLFTIAAYLLAKISPLAPVHEFGWLSLLFLLPIPLHALIQPGTPIFSFWGMDLTKEGLFLGLQNFLNIAALFLLALLFTYTTEPKRIMQGLHALGAPAKLAFMLSLSLRFVPLVQEELYRIRNAQASRASTGSIFSLAVPLLHKAFGRAKALSISMDSRAFDPERIRMTVYLELRKKDYLSIALLLTVLWTSLMG